MKLVIGGYAQGKLDYVCSKHQVQKNMVWEGVLPGAADGTIVINHFHDWVRGQLTDGRCPEEEISAFLDGVRDRCVDCIIISDEIGSGIVPVDAFEREYRERLGRILIQIANRAEEVERVICGIGQRLR